MKIALKFGDLLSYRGSVQKCQQSVFLVRQVSLIAYDTVYPNNIATATATIFVDRNPNAPIFSAALYQRNIVETLPIGSSVVEATATDADGVSMAPRLLLQPCFVHRNHFG